MVGSLYLHPSNRRRKGFTLVEIMLVVAIIGVLAAIAVPSFQKYIYRAQRNEALTNLKGIYTTQTSFFHENGLYGATFDEIGFEISGAQVVDPNTVQSVYYVYTMFSMTEGGQPGANFQAIATANLDPEDAMLDILMIENDLTIVE